MDKRWLFPATIEEAKQSQKEMAEKVILKGDVEYSFIAGMDVSNNRFDPKKLVFASAVLLDTQFSVIESQGVVDTQLFPYISGFLGFREAPPLIQAFHKLSRRPDVILVDGQGISHPRGLGIASQIGVLLDIPTIGVAKSILVGKPEGILGEEAGSFVPLIFKNRQVGLLLRTKKRCNPLIVSIGHKMSLEKARSIVLGCVRGYRLPEPIRQAHLAANACRTKLLSKT